ncbi:hypothetical protein DL96DRAFT_1720605 [Flagelloscypha sp. PMI_526]|nr:hypothetical protein DL96DRAFT_1720605 [Flagelloscypha sp. PMI_526]
MDQAANQQRNFANNPTSTGHTLPSTANRRHIQLKATLVVLLLLPAPVAGYFFRNADLKSLVILKGIRYQLHDVPLNFKDVSGWYGPGSWAALLTSVTSGTVMLSRAVILRSLPSGWIPDVIAVVVYCAVSMWDMTTRTPNCSWSAGSTMHCAEPELLLPLLAAYRAAAFCAGILQTYAILLFVLVVDSRHHSWNRDRFATLGQFILVWSTSLAFLFVVPHSVPWEPTSKDDVLSSSLILRFLQQPSYWMYYELLRHRWCWLWPAFGAWVSLIGSFLVVAFNPWHFRRRAKFRVALLLFFIAFAVMPVTALTIIKYADSGEDRVFPPNLPSYRRRFVVALFHIVWLVRSWLLSSIFVFAVYPLYCAVSFCTLLVLTLLPTAGVFPYSKISILELDQLGTLLIVVVYQVIHLVNSVAAWGWRRFIHHPGNSFEMVELETVGQRE